MVTLDGAPVLWPVVGKKLGIGLMKTDSPAEDMAHALLWCAMGWMVWTQTGIELPDINPEEIKGAIVAMVGGVK
jgi:hypothetical protein